MKKRVIIFSIVLTLCSGVSAFAKSKGGFSLGMFGAYVTDPGLVENTLNGMELKNASGEIDRESLMMPGAGLFARYEFKNNLFIRTGTESYATVDGSEINYNDSATSKYGNFNLDYFAVAVPLYLGINASPDKGKTNFYGAFGIVAAIVDIEREIFISNSGTNVELDGSDDDLVIGFGGLLGVEKQMTKNLYFLIEYAVYSAEDNNEVEGEQWASGVYSDYNYLERYGLPRQQIRFGLRYNF